MYLFSMIRRMRSYFAKKARYLRLDNNLKIGSLRPAVDTVRFGSRGSVV